MRYLLFLFLYLLAAPALAQSAGPYEVQGIVIDMPTENPSAARDAALAAATRQAYTQLQATDASLPALSDAALGRAVQDFELSGEKISAKRYIGIFAIRFRPGLSSSAPVAETATATAMPVAGQSDIPVTFVFASLPEWETARTALRNTAGVRGIQIIGLRRNYVDMNVRYAGTDVQQLAAALAAQGIMASNENGRWFLRLNR